MLDLSCALSAHHLAACGNMHKVVRIICLVFIIPCTMITIEVTYILA